MQSEWFFKRGYYYFTIRTEEKRVHFYENNLDLIDFWVSEISLAKRFY